MSGIFLPLQFLYLLLWSTLVNFCAQNKASARLHSLLRFIQLFLYICQNNYPPGLYFGHCMSLKDACVEGVALLGRMEMWDMRPSSRLTTSESPHTTCQPHKRSESNLFTRSYSGASKTVGSNKFLHVLSHSLRYSDKVVRAARQRSQHHRQNHPDHTRGISWRLLTTRGLHPSAFTPAPHSSHLVQWPLLLWLSFQS